MTLRLRQRYRLVWLVQGFSAFWKRLVIAPLTKSQTKRERELLHMELRTNPSLRFHFHRYGQEKGLQTWNLQMFKAGSSYWRAERSRNVSHFVTDLQNPSCSWRASAAMSAQAAVWPVCWRLIETMLGKKIIIRSTLRQQSQASAAIADTTQQQMCIWTGGDYRGFSLWLRARLKTFSPKAMQEPGGEANGVSLHTCALLHRDVRLSAVFA